MPKKAPGERWRYIAFRIECSRLVARNDFLNSLLARSKGTALGQGFRITVFDDNFGILKVPHMLKEDAIEVLVSVTDVRGMPCKVVTLKTSGTIKTLKDKYVERGTEADTDWQ
jgi:RNase P/RNase MRP subunit POP5